MICPILKNGALSRRETFNDQSEFDNAARCDRELCEWWVKDPYDRHAANCAVNMIALALTSPLSVHAK